MEQRKRDRTKQASSDRERRRGLTLATAARRRLDDLAAPRGRAWINGREVGGASERFGHLGRSHD